MRSTCNRSFGRKSGSRRSPDEVFLQSESETKSGSRRSPDEVYLQLESWAESGRSLQVKSWARSGFRRSPDKVAGEVVGRVRLP